MVKSEQSINVVQMAPQDVKGAVGVHLGAFEGYPSARLGSGYATAFLKWFCDAPDGAAFVGKVDEKVVGYIVGAPVGYQEKLNRDLAFVVARAIVLRPWLLLECSVRSALWGRMMALFGRVSKNSQGPSELPLPGPCMSLVGIGVAPDARGLGVGKRLMETFEMVARGKGMKSLRLSVYRSNMVARRLYERNGWQLMDPRHGKTVYYVKALTASEDDVATPED